MAGGGSLLPRSIGAAPPHPVPIVPTSPAPVLPLALLDARDPDALLAALRRGAEGTSGSGRG